MTVSEILAAALRELDEEMADMPDFRDKFMLYLNMGYQTILRKYYRPRETFHMRTDDSGRLDLYGLDVESVAAVRDEEGRTLPFTTSADDSGILQTDARNANVNVICQVNCPPLAADGDEPRLPVHAQYALVWYICYKQLSSGNLAKQSRAQVYMQSFYDAMSMLRPVGTGSVKRYTNFYEATN